MAGCCRLIWIALILATGCASDLQNFRPRERTGAEGPTGAPAAGYDLRFGDSLRGEARVWSDGAYHREGEENRPAVVHVGFEIENVSDGSLELELDRTAIEAIESDRGPVAGPTSAQVSGSTRVLPHGMGRADFEFPLPAGVTPREVDAFTVHWHIRAGDGKVFEQRTPFIEDRPSRGYGYPYWSPFYLGYGVHGCYGGYW